MNRTAVSVLPMPMQRLDITAFAALVVGLAATLMGFFSRDGFLEDEVFQADFMNEQLPYLFAEVAGLDQHPPLHAMQLKLWGSMFTNDKGLLLNSVVWNMVNCGIQLLSVESLGEYVANICLATKQWPRHFIETSI
jgi:hypothetical protein